jgi:hypothetical protein
MKKKDYVLGTLLIVFGVPAALFILSTIVLILYKTVILPWELFL